MTIAERQEMITQLLGLEFEDGSSYTKTELNGMDDDELQTCYDAEMEEDDTPETCSVCGEFVICAFVDEDTGQPVCATCVIDDQAQEDQNEDDENEGDDDDDIGDDDEGDED